MPYFRLPKNYDDKSRRNQSTDGTYGRTQQIGEKELNEIKMAFSQNVKKIYSKLLLTENEKLRKDKIIHSKLEHIHCMWVLMNNFPRLITNKNIEQFNNFSLILSYLMKKERNYSLEKYISKLDNIVKLFIERALQYTGFNLLIQDVPSTEDNNINQKEIYDIFNHIYPVISVLKLSHSIYLIQMLNNSDAFILSERLKNMKITIENKTFTPLFYYIKSLVKTRRIEYEWDTKEPIEYFYFYHTRESVPVNYLLYISYLMKQKAN